MKQKIQRALETKTIRVAKLSSTQLFRLRELGFTVIFARPVAGSPLRGPRGGQPI